MRLLTVCGVTLILLLGAAPLAVPGTPRLHGIPVPVAAGALGLAGVACLAGLVLLVRGRRTDRRADRRADRRPDRTPAHAAPMTVTRATPPPAARPAARPTAPPVPQPAPTPGFVAIRTRW